MPEGHVVQEQSEYVRRVALQALAQKWPDQTTRALLTERVVQEQSEYVRSAALQALAQKWPDQTTRALLAERVVQEQSEYVRSAALQALAQKWPDETTRTLLAERAVQDQDEHVRRFAAQTLAEQWPDETTRALLAARARLEGVAASLFGGQHSEFGRILFTTDLDGTSPYLDPRRPVARKHIKKAAETAGITATQLGETVRSLSQHLGWDIRRGAK